jgi:hypothetical protein
MPLPLYRPRIIQTGDEPKIIADLRAGTEPAAAPHMGDISVRRYRPHSGYRQQVFHVFVFSRFLPYFAFQFLYALFMQFKVFQYLFGFLPFPVFQQIDRFLPPRDFSLL